MGILYVGRDGRVRGLYMEEIPLESLGRLEIKRASHVEWDNERQGWRVTWPGGGGLPETFRRRSDALRAEAEHLNRILEKEA